MISGDKSVFDQILNSIKEKDLGFDNILIVDSDGIIIEKLDTHESDDTIAAECAGLFKETNRLSDEVALGETAFVQIQFSDKNLLISHVGKGYLMIGVQGDDRQLARSKFWLKVKSIQSLCIIES
ncbi:MAG: hypothetical protein CR997_05100 [Acidobacteria bacterium]|nr:MAG: hypothetical protein CR997_05100 [Acidobacteriota bacterium]